MPDKTGPPGRDLLKGERVLVTASAGSGIGVATAMRCAVEGATVILSDHHVQRMATTADEFADQFGSRPLAIRCDVTNEDDVQSMFGTVAEELGGLDVLVNNAGLGGTAEIVDMKDSEWDRVLDVTLNGTFRCTRAAMRLFRKQGHGVMVNNASVLGWRAQAGQAHYAAAKAGVMALTRCAAIEAAEFGARVNAVAPSLAIHEHLSKVSTPELLSDLASKEVFGRAAETWEIANVIVFLASDLSSYMTGEVVSVSSQHP